MLPFSAASDDFSGRRMDIRSCPGASVVPDGSGTAIETHGSQNTTKSTKHIKTPAKSSQNTPHNHPHRVFWVVLDVFWWVLVSFGWFWDPVGFKKL